jgi:hydroxyethylthiazole kinase-like uncharacterized protein yjeF
MRAPLLSTAQMREVERAALAGLPAGTLMERAGAAVATHAARLARDLPRGAPIAVLVGPGNNGGDALAAAMRLRAWGYPATPWVLDGHAPAAADAAAVRARWLAAGGELAPLAALPAALAAAPAALVIDGLFGIGLTRPLAGAAAGTVDVLAATRHPVLAIDVPSGLDADRGIVVGGDAGRMLTATETVTFLADKPGLRTGLGPRHAGRITVDLLGVGAAAPRDAGELIDAELAASLVRRRDPLSHKGSFGTVLVIGGEPGMRGAALLAACAAQAGGAGKTWMACPGPDPYSASQPHLMSRAFDADAAGADAVVIGCGLGRSAQAAQRLARALAEAQPCVVDADALGLVAADPALEALLAGRNAATILTPHPLEAARLLGCDTPQVQADRVAAARRIAERHHAIVLLKGAGTVLASPDGRWAINTTGSPALAIGGSGDVLAGLIGGLIAQAYPAWDAARLGAWLHGRAGDLWHRGHPHGAGLDPLGLIAHLPRVWPSSA